MAGLKSETRPRPRLGSLEGRNYSDAEDRLPQQVIVVEIVGFGESIIVFPLQRSSTNAFVDGFHRRDHDINDARHGLF